MKKPFRIPTSIAFLLWMTALTGLAYPGFVTLVAQLAFPGRANGSLLVEGGRVVGSSLLAQEFSSEGHFKARPSAAGYAYVGSAGSNLAATNKALAEAAGSRAEEWRTAFSGDIPGDMRHASGSGLDPDISLEAAIGQLDRVAAARGLDVAQRGKLETRIRRMAVGWPRFLEPPRVNVVVLNHLLETDPAFTRAAN